MPDLLDEIETYLASETGAHSPLLRASSVSGGCINETRVIELQDGRRFFAKINDAGLFDMFEAESKGLKLLGAQQAVRVPQVVGEPQLSNGRAYLILEYIESGSRPRDYSEVLGRSLAELHRGAGENFGLDHDNYIGSTPQPNSPSETWVNFFREQRIGFQLQLAKKNGYGDQSLFRLGGELMNRLDQFLAEPDRASLIHGDLWSGNYMCDHNGDPVIIDPAVYFADREAEFGMITLFGGLDQSFYDAYNEAWPLADGYSDRFQIYKLYHLLNHLNLFGTSYLSQCLSILKTFA